MNDQPDQQRIIQLAEKWMDGTITDIEAEEFAQWYDHPVAQEILVDASFAHSSEELSERIYNKVNKATAPIVIPFYRRQFFLRSAAAAAILLLMLSGIIYYMNDHRESKTIIAGKLKVDAEPIKALETTKAILTLADGRQVL